LSFSIVGLPDIFQQMPFEITGAPPSSLITPPDIAVVVEISDIRFVDSEGGTGFSLHDCRKAINMIANEALIEFFIIRPFLF
jgi:hypothetical protein